MLVKKGGITRRVDERRLHEYREKGFIVVEEKPVERARAEEKPTDKREKKE